MITTVLEIEGMVCAMCEAHINDAIRNAFAVKKVKSWRQKNRTEIKSEAPLPEEELRRVISATGYTLKGVSVSD